MISNTAQATNIVYHQAFRVNPVFREQQWKLSNSLQTTLDVNRLIELFSQSVQEAIGYIGYAYSNDREDIQIRNGIIGAYSYDRRLIVDQEDLGELRLTRRMAFSDPEVRQIDNLIGCLGYPLRNALRYREALRSAHTDPLTQVNNRVAMDDCMRREWELARRHKTPLSLMLIDIDHFKSFNDRYGHSYGDQILKSVAQTIRESVRASDMIFRYGGEEFVIILSNTEIAGAVLMAERIRRAIENMRLTAEAERVRVTASFGVTSLNSASSARDLLTHADQAMYQAKQNGRNQVIKSL
jgi:diguanylate cyclase (GGDEF)-like protein